jgi:hypothetical protein
MISCCATDDGSRDSNFVRGYGLAPKSEHMNTKVQISSDEGDGKLSERIVRHFLVYRPR